MKRESNQLKLCVLLLIAAMLVYTMLDYFNIPLALGINFGNMNVELMGLVVNTFFVVLLYIITYFAVDKRQIQKERNAVLTTDVLILSVYKQCEAILSQLKDRNMLGGIVPKGLDPTRIQENTTVSAMLKEPYAPHDQILRLAENGCVTREDLTAYMEVKSEYVAAVVLCCSYATAPEIYEDETVEIINEIRDELNERLLSLIEEYEARAYSRP